MSDKQCAYRVTVPLDIGGMLMIGYPSHDAAVADLPARIESVSGCGAWVHCPDGTTEWYGADGELTLTVLPEPEAVAV